MIAIRHALLSSGSALLVAATAMIAYEVWLNLRFCRLRARGGAVHAPRPARWRMSVSLMSLAWAPMLIALSFCIPAGTARVRALPKPCAVSASNSPAGVSASLGDDGRSLRNCPSADSSPVKR